MESESFAVSSRHERAEQGQGVMRDCQDIGCAKAPAKSRKSLFHRLSFPVIFKENSKVGYLYYHSGEDTRIPC